MSYSPPITANVSLPYNVDGIETDGTSFSDTGIGKPQGDIEQELSLGLGTKSLWQGYFALSAEALGGFYFNLGPPITFGYASPPAGFQLANPGTNDVVDAFGQNVSLTGYASSISFLAFSAGSGSTIIENNSVLNPWDMHQFGPGNPQPGQQFVVHYTDGSTQTITQGISDWLSGPSYGESVAVSMSYYDASDGQSNGTNPLHTFSVGGYSPDSQGDSPLPTPDVYQYTFALDPTKQVSYITLPTDLNVKILAMNETYYSTPQEHAVSSSQLGSSISFNGVSQSMGTPGVNDVVGAEGQTISLPSGHYSNLGLLGFSTNGNQPNQAFILHYADGSSQTIYQSMSDWTSTSSNYPGELNAKVMSYRDNANGSPRAARTTSTAITSPSIPTGC